MSALFFCIFLLGDDFYLYDMSPGFIFFRLAEISDSLVAMSVTPLSIPLPFHPQMIRENSETETVDWGLGVCSFWGYVGQFLDKNPDPSRIFLGFDGQFIPQVIGSGKSLIQSW